ncbi:MAG: DUF5674 family protein [Candidatus Limnocylindria bacterium]
MTGGSLTSTNGRCPSATRCSARHEAVPAVFGDRDEEALLLEHGSRQPDLWGINLYPAEHGGPDWIEYDSMINVRPSQVNRSRSVKDASVQQRIRDIVDRLVVG